jgi:hypothetical protein
MNLDFVRQLRFKPILQRYDARDSALYALSLGMGEGRVESARAREALVIRRPSLAETGPAAFFSFDDDGNLVYKF